MSDAYGGGSPVATDAAAAAAAAAAVADDRAPMISAVSYEGLRAIGGDGRPAHFALIDDDGKVLAVGGHVATAAFSAAVAAYRSFLEGNGHLRAYTKAEAKAMNNNAN